VLFSLALASSAVCSSEAPPDLDSLAATYLRLLTTVESDYDCLFQITSIDPLAKNPSGARYFAEFIAAGVECHEASEALAELGRADGIVFFRAEGELKPKTARPRILDLIHEINPDIVE